MSRISKRMMGFSFTSSEYIMRIYSLSTNLIVSHFQGYAGYIFGVNEKRELYACGGKVVTGIDSKVWKRMQRRLGRRVRVLRRARDLDQLALARMAGYKNANVICDIEKGNYNPTLHKLYAIAATLDTTSEALLGRTPLKRTMPASPAQVALLAATASLPPDITNLIVALALGLRKELLSLS
jgi:transcriptional regulator with XRE-family HTH domain